MKKKSGLVKASFIIRALFIPSSLFLVRCIIMDRKTKEDQLKQTGPGLYVSVTENGVKLFEIEDEGTRKCIVRN